MPAGRHAGAKAHHNHNAHHHLPHGAHGHGAHAHGSHHHGGRHHGHHGRHGGGESIMDALAEYFIPDG